MVKMEEAKKLRNAFVIQESNVVAERCLIHLSTEALTTRPNVVKAEVAAAR